MVDTILLEKWLIFDASMKNREITVHNITDLEAYYNRQLPNVSYLIQESVGFRRKGIKTIVNVITKFKYHVHTNFGISRSFYRGERIELVENG